MTIKELRDNIDKIDDENLESLLADIFRYGRDNIYYFSESLKDIVITDYTPILYSVVEREKKNED